METTEPAELTFLPLGGLGRIGMNNLVMRWREHRWLIDCGIMFPDERIRFVDKVLPDLDWIAAHSSSFRGIMLTHGHEDHIGALPFVLRACDMPVYGSRFTLALVRRRLEEHRMAADLRLMEPDMGMVRFDGVPEIGFRLIRVTHSLPDAASLVIDTPLGTILHTGDFKIDPEPMDGQAFDAPAFEKLGDEGVLLLLSDSTGGSADGATKSERSVVDRIEQIVRGWEGRVIVCQFSSNLHRMRGMEEIAERLGRRLCLVGRSLQRYAETARLAGIASIDTSRVLRAEDLESTAPADVLVVITGSQAERRAGLMRAALDDSPFIKIRRGDLVIISARKIPGNEDAIYDMINQLTKRGAVVMHRGDIHTSGHARRDELAEMIRLIRPQHFVPVHGEYSFLVDHAALAQDNGIENTLIVTNGEEFGIHPTGGLTRIADHALETHYHDGSITGTRGELHFDDRRHLFHNGVITAHVTVHGRQPELACTVDLQARGVRTSGGLLDNAAQRAASALSTAPKDATSAQIEDVVAVAVRRFCRKELGKKPVIVTFVTENA